MNDDLPEDELKRLLDENDRLVAQRELDRYLAAGPERRRIMDAIDRGTHIADIEDRMRVLLDSGDERKIRAAAHWIATHLERERDK